MANIPTNIKKVFSGAINGKDGDSFNEKVYSSSVIKSTAVFSYYKQEYVRIDLENNVFYITNPPIQLVAKRMVSILASLCGITLGNQMGVRSIPFEKIRSDLLSNNQSDLEP